MNAPICHLIAGKSGLIRLRAAMQASRHGISSPEHAASCNGFEYVSENKSLLKTH